MLLSTLLVVCFLGGSLCMDCNNKKANFATCYIDSESGLKGTIDFAQTAPLGCFGPHDPIEVMVSLTGFNTNDAIKEHGIIVKEYGDITDCGSSSPIFIVNGETKGKRHRRRRRASNVPTGFLGNYVEGSQKAFTVLSDAQLRGPKSIIGRALVILEQPYSSGYKPLGCCVIGVATGSRFAGMPKRQNDVNSRPAFAFKPPPVHEQPIRSSNFFHTTHPFEGRAPKSLPFTTRDDPRPVHNDFVFDLKNLHAIGTPNFGTNDFGFGGSFSGPSKLRPSIANIDKPPSPPRFPGNIHAGGSPLFGDFGGSRSSVGKDFGFDIDSIRLTPSEKFIPHEGEETHPTDSGYDNQGSSDKGSDQGTSSGPGYAGSDKAPVEPQGYVDKPHDQSQGYKDQGLGYDNKPHEQPQGYKNPQSGYDPKPHEQPPAYKDQGTGYDTKPHEQPAGYKDQEPGYDSKPHEQPPVYKDQGTGYDSKPHEQPQGYKDQDPSYDGKPHDVHNDGYVDPHSNIHPDVKPISQYDPPSSDISKPHDPTNTYDSKPDPHSDVKSSGQYDTPSGTVPKPYVPSNTYDPKQDPHSNVKPTNSYDQSNTYVPQTDPHSDVKPSGQYDPSNTYDPKQDPHSNVKPSDPYDQGNTYVPQTDPHSDVKPSGQYDPSNTYDPKQDPHSNVKPSDPYYQGNTYVSQTDPHSDVKSSGQYDPSNTYDPKQDPHSNVKPTDSYDQGNTYVPKPDPHYDVKPSGQYDPSNTYDPKQDPHSDVKPHDPYVAPSGTDAKPYDASNTYDPLPHDPHSNIHPDDKTSGQYDAAPSVPDTKPYDPSNAYAPPVHGEGYVHDPSPVPHSDAKEGYAAPSGVDPKPYEPSNPVPPVGYPDGSIVHPPGTITKPAIDIPHDGTNGGYDNVHDAATKPDPHSDPSYLSKLSSLNINPDNSHDIPHALPIESDPHNSYVHPDTYAPPSPSGYPTSYTRPPTSGTTSGI